MISPIVEILHSTSPIILSKYSPLIVNTSVASNSLPSNYNNLLDIFSRTMLVDTILPLTMTTGFVIPKLTFKPVVLIPHIL